MNLLQVFKTKRKGIETKGDFVRLVRKLHKNTSESPYTSIFDKKLSSKYNVDTVNVWYTSQGEHWLGWLDGYSGSGFYNRKDPHRTPEFIYNHIMCPQMLIWLAESVGVSPKKIIKAISSAMESPKYQTQCASIRKLISWNDILIASSRL